MKIMKTILFLFCVAFIFTACAQKMEESETTLIENMETQENEGEMPENSTTFTDLDEEGTDEIPDDFSDMFILNEYIEGFLLEPMGILMNGVNNFSNQANLLLYEESAIDYDAWREETLIYVGDIQKAAGIFMDYDTALVPEEFQELHNLYVLASIDLDQAMDAFIRSTEGQDPDASYEFSNLMVSGIQKAEDARLAFRALLLEDLGLED